MSTKKHFFRSESFTIKDSSYIRSWKDKWLEYHSTSTMSESEQYCLCQEDFNRSYNGNVSTKFDIRARYSRSMACGTECSSRAADKFCWVEEVIRVVECYIDVCRVRDRLNECFCCAVLCWLWNMWKKFTVEGSFPSQPASWLYKLPI
jgi:hypothetical protein